MDILLSDPEILKKMAEIAKKEKEEKKNYNNNNNINNNNINSNNINSNNKIDKYSFKQTLHQIKLQTDNIKEEDISNKVNNILNQEQPSKSLKDILNDELNKQDKWKLRFAQKKKLLSKKVNIINEGEINFSKSQSGDIINVTNLNSDDFQKYITKEKENKNEEIIKEENTKEEIKDENKNEEIIKDDKKNKEIIKKQNEIIDNKNENNIKEIDEINTNKKENQIESEKEKTEDVKKIEADENIKNTINQKLKSLDNLINENPEKEDEKNKEKPIQFSLDNIPPKFQNSYLKINNKINQYIDDFNTFFYKDIFENFFLKLKRLVDEKYNKYIEISTTYHSQIKEFEYLCEDETNEDKKNDILFTIDSLKEEQQHEIGKIEDYYNGVISAKIKEFKLTSCKTNPGLELMEEKLKLDIYTIINEIFYK